MNINFHDARSINVTEIKTQDDGETNWITILVISKSGERNEITFFSTNKESLEFKQVPNIWSL
jgi:hypothetical protein